MCFERELIKSNNLLDKSQSSGTNFVTCKSFFKKKQYVSLSLPGLLYQTQTERVVKHKFILLHYMDARCKRNNGS